MQRRFRPDASVSPWWHVLWLTGEITFLLVVLHFASEVLTDQKLLCL